MATRQRLRAAATVSAAVIADTHLRRAGGLPQGCLERIAAADVLIHAGDLIAADVLDELESLGPKLHAVRGNVDEPAVRRRLPETLEIDLPGGPVGLIHDAGPARGRLMRLRGSFPRCSAVIFGHSHIPLHERQGGFQIFNPGSPTARRRQPRHTMGLLTLAPEAVGFELIRLD